MFLNFDISESNQSIRLEDSIISIGSCFSENIGQNLIDHKFDCFSNPFGMIYNPISICESLNDEIDEDWMVESQGVYFHWQAHGKIAGLTREEVKTQVLAVREELRKNIEHADWLIITVGSAYAYRQKSTGRIVANCHKIPQKEFKKELLTIKEITDKLTETLQNLKTLNPKLKTILTVSPVRHFRDGLVENNRSKGRLLEVVHTVSEGTEDVFYFPAYEIQIDELRDYRFYGKDHVHPSAEAIDYIWKRFGETYFDDDTSKFVEQWSHLRGAMNHRPIHPHSKEHQKFLQKTIERLELLSGKVDVSEEVSLLQKQIK